MKKLILLITACLISLDAAAGDSSTPPVFQIRRVLDAPSDDSEAMTLITKNKDGAYTNVFDVQKTVLLDQTALKSARPAQDARGTQVISIDLTDAGAKQFAKVTRQNIHKRLAIIIDGQLCEAPKIATAISDGKVQIGGTFSKRDAEDLARKISDAVTKD